MNVVLTNPMSTKRIRRELHKQGISGRAAIQKPFISDAKTCNRKKWCLSHKAWTMEQWNTVIWSDMSCFTLFPTYGRVYIWRTPSQPYNTDCLLPRVKHGRGSVMVLSAITWFSVGPMITLQGYIKAKEYVNILADQVHSMVQALFPNSDVSSKTTKLLFTQLTSSRTGFLTTRMNCHISPGQSP
ncbi:Transposable element Tc1 transposase [Araneus ventricosus]|uniref:Transposable element Tc1 transposase n=1 Tax=Araneus ventricosus TaxID=182803 RepID=A0A4Y2FH09_ARAVE|nr:Transposable element Tc1 transposase [Araneus ventricosus]